MRMDPNYPKLIEKGFEGIPNNIDAAFVWSGNGKIYFFKVNHISMFFIDSYFIFSIKVITLLM